MKLLVVCIDYAFACFSVTRSVINCLIALCILFV